MTLGTVHAVYGAVFLAVLLLVEGLSCLYADRRAGRRAANRRMRMLASGASGREVFESLRRRPRGRGGFLGPLRDLAGALDSLIRQAGLSISMRRLLVLSAALGGAALAAGATVARASGPLLMLPVLALTAAAGIAAPLVVLKLLKSRRLKLFGEQLPDALDAMVRSLQAGHPVSAAMALVTREMPDPIGSEFGLAVDEMTYGLDLREALTNLGDRVDLEDFQYVVVSIGIQHETGGNLAEVLRGLSAVLRARQRMFRRTRALAAEGRLSASVLAVLPFAFAGFVFLSRPDYYLSVATDPLVPPLVAAALGLELLGIYVMHRLVNFRV